jgi:hypothetical protein
MWFVFALVLGGLIGALVLWLRSRSIRVAWYEWLIGAVGLLMVLFGAQNFIGSQHEIDAGSAASMYLLVAALPGLILMVVAWLLASRRQKTA